MLFFSILVVISSLISMIRYSNFFLFQSHVIYDFSFNVIGVSAGGAIMSVVFSALNYLTGFVFLFILLNVLRSEKNRIVCIKTFLLSCLLVQVVGYLQSIALINFGNYNPVTELRMINSTLKDSLSFGAFLSAGIPLFFGVLLFQKKRAKILPLILFTASFYLLFRTGSLSAIISLFVAAIVFLVLIVRLFLSKKHFQRQKSGKTFVVISIIFSVVLIIASSLFLSKQSSSIIKWKRRAATAEKKDDLDSFLSGRLSYFWELALQMGKDYPLSGVGVGSYIIELPNYARIYGKESRTTDSAENYFLQIFSEFGIFGLFLSFWIFWELFKALRTGQNYKDQNDRWMYIKIGITSSLVALMMIYFFHTFIGSYEIKYTFWFLAGLIVSLYPQNFQNGFKRKNIKRFNWIARISILLFSAALLWSSFHSLSLEQKTKRFDIKHEFGLYDTERSQENLDFRWTKRNSCMTVTIEKPIIEIPIHASHPDIQADPVLVEILMIKDHLKHIKKLDQIILNTNIWRTFHYDLSANIGQDIVLLFKVSRTWNPQKIMGVQDSRNLGIAIGKILFKDKNLKK